MTLNLREFNIFFTEYQQRFVHFATTYIHDEVAAEDLVIESMMYYWKNKERLADDTNVPAYVLTTLKHKCIDHLRHQQKVMQAQKEIGDFQKWDLDFRVSSLKDFEPDNVFTLLMKYRALSTRPWLPCLRKRARFLRCLVMTICLIKKLLPS